MDTDSAPLFAPGTQVVVARRDPDHHNRAPVYMRGAPGTVRRWIGAWRLPDLVSQQIASEPENCYSVEFAAVDLFGDGTHLVCVDVWESWMTRQ